MKLVFHSNSKSTLKIKNKGYQIWQIASLVPFYKTQKLFAQKVQKQITQGQRDFPKNDFWEEDKNTDKARG